MNATKIRRTPIRRRAYFDCPVIRLLWRTRHPDYCPPLSQNTHNASSYLAYKRNVVGMDLSLTTQTQENIPTAREMHALLYLIYASVSLPQLLGERRKFSRRENAQDSFSSKKISRTVRKKARKQRRCEDASRKEGRSRRFSGVILGSTRGRYNASGQSPHCMIHLKRDQLQTLHTVCRSLRVSNF